MYGKEFLESDSSWRRVLVFRIHENFVHSSYVYAWLKFGGFRAQVVRLAGGNLSKTINQKEISRIGIPIPPLETQLLLSSLVARVDALNSTSKEVDNLNDALSAKTQELISSILAVIETDIAESRG
jgi:restriction endonuclease S subunit